MAAIVTLLVVFFTLESRTMAIVERLGKPLRKVGPGLHIKVPFVRSVGNGAPVTMIAPNLIFKLPAAWGEQPSMRMALARSSLQQARRNR